MEMGASHLSKTSQSKLISSLDILLVQEDLVYPVFLSFPVEIHVIVG